MTKNIMKIAAWSDGHGTLPMINQHVDIVIIAGDFVPLHIQRNDVKSLEWFRTDFFDYVINIDCDKVIMTPGNHDFFCDHIGPSTIKGIIDNTQLVKDKLIYLVDEEYIYKDIHFYGCPWCTGPYGWAFSPSDTFMDTYTMYDYIPSNCDILITHQPPKIDKVGCSNPYTMYERNFGSDHLRNILDKRNIKLCFCGHIHTGTHNGVEYIDTKIYNVSLKNEDYNDVYEVTYLDF